MADLTFGTNRLTFGTMVLVFGGDIAPAGKPPVVIAPVSMGRMMGR